MNLTLNARRLAAMAVVPALLLTAACGSDPDDSGKSATAVASVSGKFGEQPKISIPDGKNASDKPVYKTLTQGDGKVVEKGDFVRLDFAAQSWKDGKDLGGTWAAQPGTGTKTGRQQAVEQTGEQSRMLPKKIFDAVVGKKAGSRLLVQGSASDLVGESLNPQSGLKPEDDMVWVLDVVGASKTDKQGEVKGEQAAPGAGMPAVKAEPKKAATITVPKGEKAPKKLKDQVLVKGDGPKVEAGQGLIAQYTGVAWEDGKKFDSSWDHGGATAFQIGTGAVVPGWDKGLVGKNVGDRVLLVVPPSDGYGATPDHELAKKTLVFVVDILGTV